MSTPAHKVREPIMDTPVVTADGEQFGYVKQVQGGYFKIDVPMAKDYWLSTAYIADSTLDRVVLSLNRSELDEHRLSAVPSELQQESDQVISDVEALQQREKMERELEMQRERMRTGQV
jgi:hypothetical protein